MPEYGDQEIEPKHIKMMNTIARFLDQAFNGEKTGKMGRRKVGFVLLVFNYGEDKGRCNYISNGASREDVVTLLREQANRFEEDLKKP